MTAESTNSVPQLSPVFSYAIKGGGDIYVYVARSKIAQFAVISYDDTGAEVFYAIETRDQLARYVARELVEKAAEEWNKEWDNEDNPFDELLNDTEAMQELTQVLRQEGE